MGLGTVPQAVFEAGLTLGEGPAWDAARGCLWLVDIKECAVLRFDPQNGAHQRWAAPGQVGWVLPADDGRLLAGLQDGLYIFDPQSGSFEKIGAVPGEPAGNRLNDACTDGAGRVWFGSMDDAEAGATGKFYRFSRGEIEQAGPAGISITNGPAVSGDGKRIYFTDTLGQAIFCADLSADGTVSEHRLFADTSRDFPEAYPDGPVVDAEGCVWTGLFNGWGVARYSPEGQLLGRVDLPTVNVTKLAFGGDDLRTAYVTTARKGMDDKALAEQPLAGAVFSFRAEVAGVPSSLARLS